MGDSGVVVTALQDATVLVASWRVENILVTKIAAKDANLATCVWLSCAKPW